MCIVETITLEPLSGIDVLQICLRIHLVSHIYRALSSILQGRILAASVNIGVNLGLPNVLVAYQPVPYRPESGGKLGLE